jgi:hypothetical protein
MKENSTGETCRTIKVPLSQGRFAIIDADDADKVLQYKWTLCERKSKFRPIFYARRNHIVDGVQHTIFLHREIINAPKGVEVDHKNGDGLDCRKENLRLATKGQNQINRHRPPANKFGYTGVCLLPKNGKYFAQITFNNKKIYSKRFKTVIEAAKAYDEMAVKFFGEFAVLNFPKGGIKN